MMIVVALFSGVCVTAHAEEAHDVTVDTALDARGNEIDLTVSLSRNDGLVALVLRVEYDAEALTLKAHSFGSALNDFELKSVGTLSPCIVQFATGTGKNDASTGRLVTLTFEKKAANVADPRIAVYVCDLAYKEGGVTVENAKYNGSMPYTTGGVVIMEAGSPAVIADPEESGTRTLVIVLACVGGAAILGGGAAAYLLYRKRNKKVSA